ncbi:sperm-associated antigen 5 isoform X2 [Myripristis murdjan]|uniref:sperm-associated antigen 5 isoform X2 n=1 Tax=Myripristis murdjan TaxID=586833 RepID=UPI0011764968|nr:sperm-associated antigen 5 isoform X2 [Myripristis murdjan]
MSSRKSSSNGDSLPPITCGERTPLRSLQNDILHLSTPSSRLKSRSLPDVDAMKMTKRDVHFCGPDPNPQCPPSVNVTEASPPKFLDKMSTIDAAATEATFGFGDITFKSIVCAGGEVEISGSSMLAEHSIVLCQDQTTKNTYETEDSVISDSMIVQSCDAHIEHPYYNPERGASSVNIDSACLSEMSNTTLALWNLHDTHNVQVSTVTQNDLFGAKDVTFKSFNCDGGEVEVSDTTRLPEETIPLPEVQLEESLQCNSVNSSIFSDDCSQPCQVEHIDHPYYSGKNDVAPSVTHMSTFSETPDGVEKTADRLTDITFKSFTCTGGEIEVSDGTELADETIPLLMCQFANSSVSDSDSINLSTSAVDYNLQYNTDHLDHPYCHIENSISSQSGKLPVIQEPLPCCLDELNEAEQTSLLEAGGQTGREGDGICTGVEVGHSDAIKLSEKTSPLPKDQTVICQSLCNNSTSTRILQGDIPDHCEQSSCHLERDEVLLVTDPPGFSAPLLASTAIKAMKDVSLNCQVQETSTSKDSLLPEDLCLPSVCQGAESSDCRQLRAFEGNALPVAEQVHPQCDFNVPSRNDALESNEAKHSAVDSTGNAPVVSSSAEKPPTDNPSDVLKELSEFPSVAKSMQLKILSPFVRGNSLARVQAYRALDQFLAEDSALEDEKSLLAPANPDPTGLWPGVLESPMPCPLFNSTTLGTRDCDRPQPALVTEKAEDLDVKPCTMPLSEVEKAVLDRPLIPEGPLQQQLRQMAEFLIFASGRMDTAAVSVPAPPPPTHTVKSGDPLRTESHSVCVGTSPVKLVDHSLNTSGQFERKREFSVADNCTITDPLLWNVPPGSLECLPRPELEQRLRSSMIMVEALVQQLAAARTHGGPTAGPAPSDMREKLVQTDHTELNQTTMYRDLYMTALGRIRELEEDESSLQNLIQCMQDTRITMAALSCETDVALSSLKQIGDLVKEDHQSLATQYGHMKSLYERSKETQTRMMQKVKDTLQHREDMRHQMQEAFTAKEAAFSVMEQVRTHCAMQISELEESVGSHQELMAALTKAYPEQAALNKAYVETLNTVSDLLTKAMTDQTSLTEELHTVWGLLQRTAPVLLKLNEKAAAALTERDQHASARDHAVEEREQIKEDLNEANLSLQDAREQISDLNLQVTIMTSEMGVLRQKLSEGEEERAQLERKVTELSATVSSTLASYTFLEQALGAETTKLQQSWKDVQQAKDKADELEVSLDQSQQRVCELSEALAHREEQLNQLQALSHTQSTEIKQLQDVCTQLNGVQEMNEFLQMENELAREQVAESEKMLRANLQGLRERNIQCEDLKAALGQLQLENKALQVELESTSSRASATQLELGEKLAQAVTDVTLLHHTLRGLTNELHATLSDKKTDPAREKELQSVSSECHHPSSSFVDSIMVALTAERGEDMKTETPAGEDTPEPQCEGLFSEMSAFTRIAAITPKNDLKEVESEPQKQQNNVTELLADLGKTVSELVSTLKLVQQHKDAQLEVLHNTISGLQEEQQAAVSRHKAEVWELKDQLSRLNNQVQRGNVALQQKAQDEKAVTKLLTEVNDARELLNKHKTENNELFKEVSELRRALQQSQVEAQVLREELRKAGSQSATPAHFMDEKICLLKEVERLKGSLQEVEQARAKLLERAKRHQMIHQTNQQKMENELRILDNMIDTVRKTLLSVPEVVKNCEQLRHLVEYIG